MKMDVIAATVLEEIKKLPGFEDAIIAGGACRDHVMGGQFKDIDIFVDNPNSDFIFGSLDRLLKKTPNDEGGFKSTWHFGPFKYLDSKKGYDDNPRFISIMDLAYADNVPIQVIHCRFKDPLELLESFDFNINKVFFDGVDIIETKEFKEDVNHRKATLTNIEGIHQLPNLITRFNRWRDKYPGLTFNCPRLKLIEDDKNKQENRDRYLSQTTSSNGPVRIDAERRVRFVNPQQVRPRQDDRIAGVQRAWNEARARIMEQNINVIQQNINNVVGGFGQPLAEGGADNPQALGQQVREEPL